MSKNETSSRLDFPRASETATRERSGGSGSNSRSPAQGDIGFVGLGQMGTAMAANLVAAGRRVIAYVRRPEQQGKLAALGLKPTTNIADLFDCEIVISMLPDDAAVREIVFGREAVGLDGLAQGLRPGAVHLSMSTTSTAAASELASEHAMNEQGYVAAPVFGNPMPPRRAAVHRRAGRRPMSSARPLSTISANRRLWSGRSAQANLFTAAR